MLIGNKCRLIANLYALKAPAAREKLIRVLTTVFICSPIIPIVLGIASLIACIV